MTQPTITVLIMLSVCCYMASPSQCSSLLTLAGEMFRL